MNVFLSFIFNIYQNHILKDNRKRYIMCYINQLVCNMSNNNLLEKKAYFKVELFI